MMEREKKRAEPFEVASGILTKKRKPLWKSCVFYAANLAAIMGAFMMTIMTFGMLSIGFAYFIEKGAGQMGQMFFVITMLWNLGAFANACTETVDRLRKWKTDRILVLAVMEE